MNKKLFVTLVLAAVVCLLPAACLADTAGWEFTTAGNQFTNGAWEFGEVFTVNTNIMVDFLGYYNPTAGMTASHEVDLYNAAGTLLASSVINSSSGFSTANFLYNSISPIELFAGQTYVVEGLSSTDNYTWNDTGFTTFAPITIVGNNYQVSTTPVFNGTSVVNNVTDGYWGANFGWAPAVVPEPGSLLMIGTGLLGLAAALRRKRNVQ